MSYGAVKKAGKERGAVDAHGEGRSEEGKAVGRGWRGRPALPPGAMVMSRPELLPTAVSGSMAQP